MTNFRNFRLTFLLLLLSFCIVAPVFSQLSDSRLSNLVLEEDTEFKQTFSILPLVLLSSIVSSSNTNEANFGIGIPLRYELKFPNSPVMLSLYNGLFVGSIDSVGSTVYDEIRFGPRFQLSSKKLDGFFIRPLVHVGFGTIPYAWNNTEKPQIMNTFVFGASLDVGYTLVLDIGFVMELYGGAYYSMKSIDNMPVPDEFGPYLGIGVGWSF